MAVVTAADRSCEADPGSGDHPGAHRNLARRLLRRAIDIAVGTVNRVQSRPEVEAVVQRRPYLDRLSDTPGSMQGDRQDGSGQLVAGIELQHPFELARRALELSRPRIDQTSVDLDAEGERIESVRALDLGYCVGTAARGLVEIRPVLNGQHMVRVQLERPVQLFLGRSPAPLIEPEGRPDDRRPRTREFRLTPRRRVAP